MLLLAIPTTAFAVKIDVSAKYDPSNGGDESSAGTLIVNWTAPEATQDTKITISASTSGPYFIGNTGWDGNKFKIDTNGKTSGTARIPIAITNTNSYGYSMPENNKITIKVDSGDFNYTESVIVSNIYTDTPADSATSATAQPGTFGNTEPIKEEGGWLDKMLAAPINLMVDALRALGLEDLDVLIFNIGREDYFIPPFVDDTGKTSIDKWFTGFYYASFGLILLGIFYTGAKMSFAAYTPKRREEVMKGLTRLLYAFIIIWAAPLLIELFVKINIAAVEFCADIASTTGIMGQFSATGNGAGGEFIESLATGHVLTTAIVKLAAIGIMIYFNVLYLVRALVLSGLYALTPFLIWIWAITGNETALKVWFGEITSVIFMQFIHAFSILFFLSFAMALNQWWAIFVALVMIIPFANVIRNIFQGFLRFLGLNEEGIAGGAMGMLGGIAAMGKATIAPGVRAGSSIPSPVINSAGGSTGGVGGPFGVINAPTGDLQPKGGMATLSKIGQSASKVGGAVGSVAGTMMAAPMMIASPQAAGLIGNLGQQGIQKITEMGAKTFGAGAMVASKTYEAGKENIGGLNNQQGLMGKANWTKDQLSQGIQRTATISNPVTDEGRKINPDLEDVNYVTQKPASVAHAAGGLAGAILSRNTPQGYKAGSDAVDVVYPKEPLQYYS